MSITIGYWVIPALLTIAAFIWAEVITPRRMSGYFPDLTGLFTYGAALVASLVFWLIWAVLT